MPTTQQSPMAVSGARYSFTAKAAAVSQAAIGPFCIATNGYWSAGAVTNGSWQAGALTTDSWTAGHVAQDTSCN